MSPYKVLPMSDYTGMLPVGVTQYPTPGGLDFNKLPRIASAKFVFEDGTEVVGSAA